MLWYSGGRVWTGVKTEMPSKTFLNKRLRRTMFELTNIFQVLQFFVYLRSRIPDSKPCLFWTMGVKCKQILWSRCTRRLTHSPAKNKTKHGRFPLGPMVVLGLITVYVSSYHIFQQLTWLWAKKNFIFVLIFNLPSSGGKGRTKKSS